MNMKIDIPKPEDVSGQRYFLIRNCGADGCGNFQTYCVARDTTTEEIMSIAAQEHTEYMMEQEKRYIPMFFNKPPKWRSSLKVIEQSRSISKLDPVKDKEKIERSGRDYTNKWTTKRGGLKFTIENNFIRVKTNLGVHEYNGYTPGSIIKTTTSIRNETN
jgi:hypothetical protein